MPALGEIFVYFLEGFSKDKNKIPNQTLILTLISKITSQSLVFLSDGSGVQECSPFLGNASIARVGRIDHHNFQLLASNRQPPIPQDRLVRHYSCFSLTFTDTPKTTGWRRNKCSSRLPSSTSRSFPSLPHP